MKGGRSVLNPWQAQGHRTSRQPSDACAFRPKRRSLSDVPCITIYLEELADEPSAIVLSSWSSVNAPAPQAAAVLSPRRRL